MLSICRRAENARKRQNEQGHRFDRYYYYWYEGVGFRVSGCSDLQVGRHAWHVVVTLVELCRR